MKLLVVGHERCGETDGHTLLWVPDSFHPDEDSDDLYNAIDAAEKAYLADAKALQEARDVGKPEDPGYNFNATKYPDDMTIGEAKADWEAKRDAYTVFRARESKAGRYFDYYLLEAIPGSINFWQGVYDEIESLPLITGTAIWGHRHGQKIEYGETKIKDMAGYATETRGDRAGL